MMPVNTIAKAFAENNTITALSRIVMLMAPAVCMVFLYFSGDWVNSHVTAPIAAIQAQIKEVSDTNGSQDKIIEKHDIILNTEGQDLAAMRNDVKELGGKLDTLNTSLSGLIEVLKDRDTRRNGVPQ
jgi:hypothetical protein